MNLEVVWSTKIQGKKPWPQFAWLQKCGSQEGTSKSLFLLENTRIGQLSLDTGKTSQSFPSLSGVQLVLTQASHSGAVVAGLTDHGHMITWLQPSHQLATYTTPLSASAPHTHDIQGCHVFVSDSGEQALLVTGEFEVHLWELRDGLHSEWWKVPAPDDICLPHTSSRDTAVDATFHVHQVLGECCECDIVFTNQETGETTIANLLLTWNITHSHEYKPAAPNLSTGEQASSNQNTNEPAKPPFPVTVDWKTCTVSSEDSSSRHAPSGSGCYVVKLSPTARVAAVAVNHNTAADTHILFMDLWNEVSVTSPVYLKTDSKMTGRILWVASLGWSGDGLLLGVMTHRGCLLLLPRFGPPLRLITSGCGLDLGPSYTLPLHPLITVQNKNVTAGSISESFEGDPLRQRFSVATHPHLPLLLCSDGYCLTVLRLPSANYSLPHLVVSLLNTGRSLLGVPLLTASSNSEACGGVDSKSLLCAKSVSQLKSHVIEDPLTHLCGGDHGSSDSTALHDNDQLPCVNDLGHLSKDESQRLAQAHLLSAWGLLLSAGNCQPGNGVYPMHLNSHDVKRLSSDIKIVKNLVITTMVTFSRSPLDDLIKKQFLLSALSMSFLDELDQNCHKLVYNLASSSLLSLLSGVLQEHMVFASSSTHTVASVEMYAEHITSSLQEFWKTFQEVSVLVAKIYSLSTRETREVFSLPLLVLRRACSILSSDLLACNRLAQSMLPAVSSSLGLQGREAGMMQGNVARHISEASAVLASISDILASYMDQSDLVVTGFNTGEHSQCGNVEGGVGIMERVPYLLQQCNLLEALRCMYSVICGHSDNVPTCQLSVPGASLIPSSVLAEKLVSIPLLESMLQLVGSFMGTFFCSKTAKTIKCPIPETQSYPYFSRKSIEVAHKSITAAITKQNLSNNWTPSHAVELLLLGGLWYSAARMAVRMGDWKRGLMLCALHITLGRSLLPHQAHSDMTAAIKQVGEFAQGLAVGKILRELGLSRDKRVKAKPVDQPQPDIRLISGFLTVCERGGVGGVCSLVSFLIHQRLWAAVECLPVRVPEEFPLPSPPLYCSSPSTTDNMKDSGEGQRRQALAHVIRSSLRMFHGSNSMDLCRDWYCSSLVQLHSDPEACPRTRHMPGMDGTITELEVPSTLLQLSTSRSGLSSDMSHDMQCQLALFRELCGLLWLLYVRDKASQHLRQVFQSDLRDKATGLESDQTLSECALWCARLLPLRHCHKNPSHIEDMLLSALSELPCNQLLVTLLAQSFPDSPQPGSKRLKMEQLLARMRTAVSKNDTAQPLSVDYQIVSQAVLEDQASDTLQTFGPLCFKSDSGQHELKLKKKALDVGSFMFEYDQAYLDFLDLCFSSFAKPSTQKSQSLEPFPLQATHGTLNNTTATISSFHNISILSQSISQWETPEELQGLVTYLYEWSQRPDSKPMEISSGEHRNKTGHHHMKTELSLSFLMYCLKLEEEKHKLRARGHNISSSSQETVTAYTETVVSEDTIITITPAADDTISTITAVREDTPSLTTITAYDGISSSTITGELSDPCSMTTITPLQDSIDTVTADTESPTLSDSTLHAEDLDTPHSTPNATNNFGLYPFPLLHLPKDCNTIQEVQQPGLAMSVPTLRSTTTGDDLTVSGTISLARDVSSSQLISDVDLTDSQSTGEVPSLLTFSVGEFGSEFQSTADVLPQSAPLAAPGGDGESNRTHKLIQEPQLLDNVVTDSQQREPRVDDSPSPVPMVDPQPDHPNACQSTPVELSDVLQETLTHPNDGQPGTADTNKNDFDKQRNTRQEREINSEEVDGTGIEGHKSGDGATNVQERGVVQLSPTVVGQTDISSEETGLKTEQSDEMDSEAAGERQVAVSGVAEENVDGIVDRGQAGGGKQGESGRDATGEVHSTKGGGGDEPIGSEAEGRTITTELESKDENLVVEMPSSNVDEQTENQPPSVSQTTTKYSSTDLRDHRKELGKIVRSELKKFFKEQHQQLMDMVVDGGDNNTAGKQTDPHSTDSCQVVYRKSPESEHTQQQSWTSTSHLSMRHLNSTQPPPAPLLLLPPPPRPPTLPPSYPSQNTHSISIAAERGTLNLGTQPPLLQLDTDSQSLSAVGQEPQLPAPPPVDSRRAGTSSHLPLLSVDHAEFEEPLLPKLHHIPVSPHVPMPPLSPTAQQEKWTLPLLQFPHPSCTSVGQSDTLDTCGPLLPTPAIHRLPSTAPTAGKPQAPGPLPLLLPSHQTTSPFPCLITPPPPSPYPPVQLLPANLILKTQSSDGQETQTSSDKLQQGLLDTDKQSLSTHLPSDEECYQTCEANTPQIDNRQWRKTQEHQPVDFKPPTPFPRASLHPSPLSHSTQAPGHLGPPVYHPIEIRQSLVPPTVVLSDHGEDIPELNGTNTLQPTQVVPSEGEGAPVNLPIEAHSSNEINSGITSKSKLSEADTKTVTVREGSLVSGGEAAVGRLMEVDKGNKAAAEQGHGIVKIENNTGDGGIHEWLTNDGTGDIRKNAGYDREPKKYIDEKPGQESPPRYMQKEEEEDEEMREEAAGEEEEGEEEGKREEKMESGVRQKAKVKVLSQLQQLGTQLAAIESKARTVEGELMISNQLLGTIEELQAVNKKHTPTSTYNRTHQRPAEQFPYEKPRESYPRATDTTNVVSATQNIQKIVGVERETLSMVSARPLSPVPLQNTPSSPIATSSSLTFATTPPSNTTISNSTTHTNVLLSTTAAATTTTSPTVVSHVATPTPCTSVPGQLKHIAPRQEESPVGSGFLPPSGRCSRQTLRKWVATKKREQSISSSKPCSNHRTTDMGGCTTQSFNNQSTEKGDITRTQSRENMSKRMEEALILMEDILSAEPPSHHLTTHHQSATSRASCSGKSSASLTRQTNASIPTTHTAKSIGSSVKQSRRRCWSSMEGLTPQEQLKMADIMASAELSSVSSGSVASTIDWELVDKLIDS